MRNTPRNIQSFLIVLLASAAIFLSGFLSGCSAIWQSQNENENISPDDGSLIDSSGSQKKQSAAHMSEAAIASHHTVIEGIYPLNNGRILSIDLDGAVIDWGKSPDFSRGGHLLGTLKKGFTATTVDPFLGLIAASYPEYTEIRSPRTFQQEFEIHRILSKVLALDFHPNGESLLLGGADGRVYRWKFRIEAESSRKKDLETSLQRYLGHSSVVSALRYHPFGRVFFSGDWNGALNAWLGYDEDPFKGKYERDIFPGPYYTLKSVRSRATGTQNDEVVSIQVSKDGEWLAVIGNGGHLQLWQVRGLRLAADVKAHQGIVFDTAIRDDGQRLASIGRDGELKIWKVEPSQVEGKKDPTLEVIKTISDIAGRKLLFLGTNKLLVGTTEGDILSVSYDTNDSN